MDQAMIAQVRRFNRVVTQHVGALDERYLARDHSLGEARVLWEIGAEGCDVRTLRTRLGLDSGYLSRLLGSLVAAGLVALGRSESDRRIRTARLTPAGVTERSVLDERTRKLYATMRDKNKVAVIDLQTNTLETTFSDPSLRTDSAMAADFAHHRLFVGNRKPGQLLVLDSQTGKSVATLPTGETSDDITYDASKQLVYITSDDGLDVVREISPDRYEAVQHVDTLGGKTSVYVPSLKRLYVVHTKGPRADVAGLQTFSVE